MKGGLHSEHMIGIWMLAICEQLNVVIRDDAGLFPAPRQLYITYIYTCIYIYAYVYIKYIMSYYIM